jgi:EAL domain-containing protein (putative c-di-GMP-specific phosphodiesterase class I)
MDQAKMLRAEGVGFLQGWAFGKPQFEPPWPSTADEDVSQSVPVTKIRSAAS